MCVIAGWDMMVQDKSLKYSGVQNACTEQTNLKTQIVSESKLKSLSTIVHLDLIWRGKKCVLAIGWEMSYN